jgi:hypothetical protein
MIHLSLVDVAARFDHLEPTQVLDGFVRASDSLGHGILDRNGRGAGEFNEFIDVVFHIRGCRAAASEVSECLLMATAGGAGFFDSLFDRFAGFARALLNPAHQFFLLAFGVLEIIVRELGPLLLQLAFGDVPVAFDFECRHNSSCFVIFRFDSPPT